MVAAPFQKQAAKLGLPVRPVPARSAVLWPWGWLLQHHGPLLRLHPGSGTGPPEEEEARGRPLGAGWAACPWLRVPRDITAQARRAASAGRGPGPGCWGGPGRPRGHGGDPLHPSAVFVDAVQGDQRAHSAPTHAQLCAHACRDGTATCTAPLARLHCSTPPPAVRTRGCNAPVAHICVHTGCVVHAHPCTGAPGHVWGGGRLRAVWASAVGLGWERCGAGTGRRPPAGRGGGVRHSLRRLLFYLVQSQFLECF